MGWNRAARTTLAADLDRAATHDDLGAADGRQAAADPALDKDNRDRAANAAAYLGERAGHLRADAAAIRDGVNPTDLGYLP
ncbi:hypothetical protein ACWEO1_20435 [Kitasatospora cineracea]